MSEATEVHKMYYDQLHQGDEGWIADVRARWQEMDRVAQGVADELDDDLGKLDAGWRSPAGDSFKTVMRKLVDTLRQTRPTATLASSVLRDAQQGLVEAKNMMPELGDSAWRVGFLDQTEEEEQEAARAIAHVENRYARAMKDLPPFAPEYAGPPPTGATRDPDDLWEPDDDPVKSGPGDSGSPSVGGPGGPTAGSPEPPYGPAGGGGTGGGALTGIGESGRTDLSGSTAPAGVGGFAGGAVPGGPGGSVPGGPGAGLPSGTGSGGGAGGSALPGGSAVPGGGAGAGAGGSRAGRGAAGAGGGRLPGSAGPRGGVGGGTGRGAAVPGGRAGGVLGGSGAAGGSAAGGRAGGTLGGPAGRGAAGGGAAGGAGARGGAGRAGMMPMGGAGDGGAGGDGGKQRPGWLREQEDVWGAKRDDVAPGVLGQAPASRKDNDEDDEE